MVAARHKHDFPDHHKFNLPKVIFIKIKIRTFDPANTMQFDFLQTSKRDRFGLANPSQIETTTKITPEVVTIGDKILKDLENLSTIDENYQTSLLIFQQLKARVQPRIKTERLAPTVYFAASLKTIQDVFFKSESLRNLTAYLIVF